MLCSIIKKARVVGLIGIAAAPDFTRDLMCQELTVDQRNALQRDGEIIMESAYDEFATPIVSNINGDSAGVRGAAQLWPA